MKSFAYEALSSTFSQEGKSLCRLPSEEVKAGLPSGAPQVGFLNPFKAKHFRAFF